MKILALDTSCKTAMAVITDNGKIIAGIQLHDEKTHSVKLLPAIEYILSAADILPQDLDCIAVTNGPGSYTGLRIGVTTAKTYAYTLNIPVIGINSLEALAASVDVGNDNIICPLIDENGKHTPKWGFEYGEFPLENQAAENVENLSEEKDL